MRSTSPALAQLCRDRVLQYEESTRQKFRPLDLASSVDNDYLEVYLLYEYHLMEAERFQHVFDILFASGATSKIKAAVFQHRLFVDGSLNVDLQLTDA